MEYTNYGIEHGCIGHTFAIKKNDVYIGLIMLGEAIEWETDPPEMKREPFYRLMGFVIDKKYRGKGIGGKALELFRYSIKWLYREWNFYNNGFFYFC